MSSKRSRLIHQHELPSPEAISENLKRKRWTAGSRRTWAPLTVTGTHFKQRLIITPKEYHRLDVDSSYQRGRTSLIPTLVRAIQAGGSVPDSPDVVSRAGGDGKLWIVDGFQRVSALMETNQTFEVNVYSVINHDAEKRLFLALNHRRSLSSNVQVKAWDGPTTTLLKAVNQKVDHPLSGNIAWDSYVGGRKLAASVLARCIERFLSAGKRANQPVQVTLARSDQVLGSSDAQRRRVTKMLELIALVTEKGDRSYRGLLALAEVASEKWPSDVNMTLPTEHQLARLQDINWRTKLPSQGEEYTDLAISIIKRIWK